MFANKVMKVSLVNMNWRDSDEIGRMSKFKPVIPLELLYIHQALKDKVDVKLFDLWIRDQKLSDIKNDLKSDYIVLNSAPSYLFWRDGSTGMKLLKKYIKELKKYGKVILIGPHPSVSPELFEGVLMVKGEPEVVLSKFFDGGDLKGFHSVNMEDLPVVKFSEYPEYKKTDFIYEMSRGCPYNCFFCFRDNFRNQYRVKSIEKIKKELEEIKKLGVKKFYLIDECFGVNKKWSEEVFSVFSGFEWGCQTRQELLTVDFIEKLANSGCKWVEIGLESADRNVLKGLNKNIDLDKLKISIKSLVDKGIRPHLFLIVGSPKENKKSLNNTLNYLKKLPLSKITISSGMMLPYPKTELWKKGLSEGKKMKPWRDVERISGTIGNDFSEQEIKKEFILFNLRIKRLICVQEGRSGLHYSLLFAMVFLIPTFMFKGKLLFSLIRYMYHSVF